MRILLATALTAALLAPVADAAKPRKADLSVSKSSASPGQVAAGAQLAINWTVKNAGAKSAGKSTTDVVLSTDAKLDPKDVKLASITRNHLVLGFMVKDRPLPPRRVHDYLRRTAPDAVDTTLLTVADRLSAQGGGVPDHAIEGHLELARELPAAAVPWEREGPLPPLLRGDEIAAETGIEPGPRLGAAVAELEAAQWCGEVGTREQAIAHLRDFAAGR